ncbi:MAG: ATP-binding protein [Pseudomonadota bacterium]
MKPARVKWRPSLGMVVVSMLLFVLILPLCGIWMFRFYDSQLVRETESELIAQGAFIQAIAKRELNNSNTDIEFSNTLVPNTKQQKFNLQLPQLDLATSPILQSRPEAIEVSNPPDKIYVEMGQILMPILAEAQRTTLAGFRVTDPEGRVVAGRSELGLSIAHVEEVRQALSGRYASTIRLRVSDSPTPPIYSISRGTGIRVFVAMPIEQEGKIVGVVYMSRTPSHFLRELYGQRWKIAAATAFLLLITLTIALIFVRTIKGPIDALNSRTKRITSGDRDALEPLEHHGTREIADLAQGLLSMSGKLQDRSDYIKNFATHVSHELKSPLTSIRGAAELVLDGADEMDRETRDKFLKNVLSDTDRMGQLLARLRELAAAEALSVEGECDLRDVVNQLKDFHPNLKITNTNADNRQIPLTLESAMIVFSNLADNSVKHGAESLELLVRESAESLTLFVQDDGQGISEANREKTLEHFFTTRRSEGGTGMGLGIVQSILDGCGGKLIPLASDNGACFEIRIPKK